MLFGTKTHACFALHICVIFLPVYIYDIWKGGILYCNVRKIVKEYWKNIAYWEIFKRDFIKVHMKRVLTMVFHFIIVHLVNLLPAYRS